MFRLLLNSNANGNRFLFFIIFLLKSGFFSKWFFSIICRVSSKNYSFPIEGIVFCQQDSKIRPRSRRSSSIGWFGLLSDLEDLQIYNWLFITKFWGVGYLGINNFPSKRCGMIVSISCWFVLFGSLWK